MTGLSRGLAMVLGLLGAAGAGMSQVAAGAGASEDFRVDNKVFVGSEKQPAMQSATIFCDGAVYDYLADPEEVIVLEKASQQFVLLDVKRRVRARVTSAEVTELADRLQDLARRQSDPFLQFLAAPKFDEKLDSAVDELTLSSSWVKYRVALAEGTTAAIARQYREFSDASTRLNTLLNPGSKPPAARLLLNEALAKRDAIPREVYLTTTPKKLLSLKRTTVRSEHRLVRPLAEADVDRVAQTRQFMELFPAVGFDEYRQAARR